MRFEMCVTRQQFVVAGVGMAEDSDQGCDADTLRHQAHRVWPSRGASRPQRHVLRKVRTREEIVFQLREAPRFSNHCKRVERNRSVIKLCLFRWHAFSSICRRVLLLYRDDAGGFPPKVPDLVDRIMPFMKDASRALLVTSSAAPRAQSASLSFESSTVTAAA